MKDDYNVNIYSLIYLAHFCGSLIFGDGLIINCGCCQMIEVVRIMTAAVLILRLMLTIAAAVHLEVCPVGISVHVSVGK